MKKITLLFLLANCFGCMYKAEKKEYNLIEKANWFIGSWENNSKEGHFTETWKKQSDSTFTGKSLIIKSRDTLFEENMVLEQRNDSLFYNVSIKGNDETYFYLTKSSANELVFENPKHDFPTKIAYKLSSKDSIIATIHGKIDGKYKSETFPMKKTE